MTALILMAIAFPPDVEPAPADIQGYYLCRGEDANGKKYSGITTIVKRGEVHVVSWSIGSSSFVGVGIRQGDRLSVSWATPGKEGILRGVNVYRIDGKTLAGKWSSLPGNGRILVEVLTFLKEVEEED